MGLRLTGVKPQDFQNSDMVYQIGVAPVRIDILTLLPGVSAKRAWKNKKRSRYGKTPIYVIGLNELIKVKKAAGRPQDILDLERLKKKQK